MTDLFRPDDWWVPSSNEDQSVTPVDWACFDRHTQLGVAAAAAVNP
jgi:hypothetical protein